MQNDFAERGIKFLTFANMSPVFKGWGFIVLGTLALIFLAWRVKRGEKLEIGPLVFGALAIFITLYGIYVLIVQPNWWDLRP